LAIQLLKMIPRAAWTILISRRQLNLPRWVASPSFTELHATISAWLDSHLAVLEDDAPWLHRTGVDVWDFCKAAVYAPTAISFQPRFRASARCVRDLIVVYGFDGDLAERITQLDHVLSTAGWEPLRQASLQYPQNPNRHVVLRWRPSALLTHPPGMRGMPPLGKPELAPTLRLSWGSGGQQSWLREDSNRKRENTRNYLTVESSGTEYWKLPTATLTKHDHVLIAHLHLGYYQNPIPLSRRYRIPRYLRPTRSGSRC
jgi:hypothetical protein